MRIRRLNGKRCSILLKFITAVLVTAFLLCLCSGVPMVYADDADWDEEWYDDGQDTGDEWYDDQDAGDEWYDDNQDTGDEWYDDGQDAEDEWYEDTQDGEDEWEENDQDADDEWSEDDQDADDEWYDDDQDTDEAAEDTEDTENTEDIEDTENTEETEDTKDTENLPEDQAAVPETRQTITRDPGIQVWPKIPELAGEAVVLMEANTQAVIYEKNPDEKMYPASTTKILTAIVVLENCSLTDTVTFTEECCNLEDGAVTIDSVPGEEMSLKDVMYGLLLPSGNDCAMALALHTAGSIEAFAEMMNAKALEIGATSSNFVNPSGLFHRNHYTTAADMAAIARYAFQNSTFVDIISHPTYIIEPTNKTPESRVLTNTHEMIIPGNPDYNSDVIGGKTGYLYEAGRCLVTYAQREGVTLLAVILDGSYYGIFGETQELLDFGWDHFTIVNVSESERRFSYKDEEARVQLDPSSEILTLNNVPFSALSSRINYAYYLDETEYAQAKEAAGILPGDPRQLYARIDYYYAGYFLGSCNVFINPELPVSKATFINMIYINFWVVLLIVILVILAVILIIRMARKTSGGSAKAREHRRSGRERVRYYNRSDSVDLYNQYVKQGNRNKSSIHGLSEIGVPDSRRTENGKARRR